jgi:membrane protein DedA with SNARE-associated domain
VSSHAANLIATHGYWIISAAVALESTGIPVPCETALLTAAIYAGTTHRLNVAFVIVAAAIGAVVGDNVGFLIGRRFGFPLLLRYGHLARIDSRRIKLGQFLFARHGGKVVFFGRFIALLRALAALLAGINRMDWWRFLLFNASGGIVWATVYGLAAYVFGEQIVRLRGPAVIISLVIASLAAAKLVLWVRRHEATLQAEVERSLSDGSVSSTTCHFFQ